MSKPIGKHQVESERADEGNKSVVSLRQGRKLVFAIRGGRWSAIQ